MIKNHQIIYYKLRDNLQLRMQVAVGAILFVSCMLLGMICVVSVSAALYDALDSELNAAAQRADGQFKVMVAQKDLLLEDFTSDNALFNVFNDASALRGTLVMIGTTSDINQISGGYLSATGEIVRIPEEASTALLNSSIIGGQIQTVNLGDTLGEYRVVTEINDEGFFLVGRPIEPIQRTIAGITTIVLGVAVLTLIAANVLVTLYMRTAMRPLRRVVLAANKIYKTDLQSEEKTIFETVSMQHESPYSETGQLILAFNRMLENISSALESRKKAENQIRSFVADASHELRTPLASIRGYTEFVKKVQKTDNPDVIKSLERVLSESDRMTSLVSDLLMLARLDSGTIDSREEIDINDILYKVVADLAHSIDNKILWQKNPEPLLIWGNKNQITQIFINLINNASIHNPSETVITVSSYKEKHAKTGLSQVVIKISDNGLGIPEEYISKIFQRFVRVDSSRAKIEKKKSSSGLGLAIVKGIVENHDGKIFLNSKPGETEFRVHIPSANK